MKQRIREVLATGMFLGFNDDKTITSITLDDGYAHYRRRVIIGLRSKGCSWAHLSHGGCTHCGISHSDICSTDETETYSDFYAEFSKYDFREFPVLCLYSPGSFFDDREISSVLRNQILKNISRSKSLKKLSIESRPEFITYKNIAELREILPELDIEVGIGLDSVNDYVRNILINKGITFESYAKACAILNNYAVDVVTYVLIKPPFLSESDAILDAITTAHKAFELESSIISLEIMNIQRNTRLYELYMSYRYRLPWLWSVIEIVKNIYSAGDVRVGRFSYPMPFLSSSNCDRCTKLTLQSIGEFNRTQKVEVFDKLCCSCKSDWEKLIVGTEVDYYGR